MNGHETYQYLVLKYVRNEIANDAIPFGLVYWKEDPSELHVRSLMGDEKLPGDTQDLELFQDRFIARVKGYLTTKKLPYYEADDAYSEAWWTHLKSILIHRFRIDGPRQIQVSNPNLDFELQFSALVRPSYATAREDVRIDSWINDALGSLQSQFRSRAAVPGFKGRKVQVQKMTTKGSTLVVIDAVNLTRDDAATQLEAMLLRAYELQQFSSVEGCESVKLVLGYYASPEGLNGEAKLVELGERLLHEPLINLSASRELFRSVVERELAEAR